jgi:hypothetical protein
MFRKGKDDGEIIKKPKEFKPHPNFSNGAYLKWQLLNNMYVEGARAFGGFFYLELNFLAFI